MNKLRIIGLAMALFLSTTALATADTPAPPTISVLTAAKKPIAEELNVTGSFAAGEMVLVSPEIEGLAVTEFLAEEGGADAAAIAMRPAGFYISVVPISPALQFRPSQGLPQEQPKSGYEAHANGLHGALTPLRVSKGGHDGHRYR